MLIEAEGLVKSYGPIRAMDHVSLKVKEGEIFGIFGPNGAGKTTTVRVLTGLTNFDEGEAYVFDIDLRENPNAIRKYVSILMELPFLYEYMTAKEYLRFFGRLSGVRSYGLKARIYELLTLVELQDSPNKKIATMSSGQRQRLEIARVLLSNARILFLDEPFTMIDIDMRRKLREYLKEWCGSSRCIFYTSHNIIESEYLVDRFSFISNGQIKAVGGARDLRQKLLVPKFFIDVSDRDRAYQLLKSQKWVSTLELSGSGLTVGLSERRNAKLIAQLMVRSNIDIYEMKGLGTMEDVFDKVMR
ncbi:MAG: ABC transporter ATP-binding protein [Thermoplasmata archaeon]|nr:MAG: ABC transporter ATP-binding protein [Thermoplasmata archaeon]